MQIRDTGVIFLNEGDRVEIRGSGSGLEAHADLVVGVPKGQRIVIHWGVGDAMVSNVDGDIRVSVASATVTSEHTKGRLNLDTGSGNVTILPRLIGTGRAAELLLTGRSMD